VRVLLVLFAAVVAATAAQAQELRRWSGGPAPALELADLDGSTHRLADYRGSAVLVNFWATWCAPCREEMPSIERLRRALDGRRFVVLAVNVGEGARVARDFTQKMPLGFTYLLDRDTRTAKAWGARLLPASFVIGPDGAVRYSYFGALDWSREDLRAAISALIE
jgi:peroxiredoxin